MSKIISHRTTSKKRVRIVSNYARLHESALKYIFFLFKLHDKYHFYCGPSITYITYVISTLSVVNYFLCDLNYICREFNDVLIKVNIVFLCR